MSRKIAGCHLDDLIYEGSNSIIYRARREADNRPVVLKMLKHTYPPPERIAWFKREFELIRNLNPANGSGQALAGVIAAYSLEVDHQRWVMVLEDFGGESLDRFVRDGPYVPDGSPAEPMALAIRVAGILGRVHQRHIMHKDINPSNIVVNASTGEVRLIDFGISTVLSRENPTLRNPNVLEGTLAYMSPEQTGRMNRALDYRTDFYSLGVTFYQMLTGQLPFPTDDPMALVHAHLAIQPAPPHTLNPAVPLPLSEIVLKLMAKNAEDRYQSAHGLIADLEACLPPDGRDAGQIEPFSLGRHDLSDRFQIPQKLYGRGAEIEILLDAFERSSAPSPATAAAGVAGGRVEMILVTGSAGIGKSALVQEIYKPVTRRRGYFISGKFDQLQRDVPYASLVQAFRSLIRQLLTESEAQIDDWRDRLLAALGSNGQVMIDVIPELEMIVGPQPAPPALPPAEAQTRFNLVFQNLIRVFTQPDHPLALFLDDLQWADAASLGLLQLLMTAPDIRNLLIIGAYRDQEVGETHPLAATLEAIQEAGAAVNRIALQPLDLPHITRLIADTLHSPPDGVEPLAQLVQAKTNGNPFFLNEFLKSLYHEGLLVFTPPAAPRNGEGASPGGWVWDLAQIRARRMTDNVVELLIGQVRKLGPGTQRVLKLAACIGNQFDLLTLAIVNEKPPSATAADLWEAIVEGLVLPLDDTYRLADLGVDDLVSEIRIDYRFAHDRIREAAYELISAADRQAVHWQVGRLLLKNTPDSEREQKIFDIVNQLNLGLAILEQPADRLELAELNLLAGRRAKASAAFGPAFNYLLTGLGLMTAPHPPLAAAGPTNGADPWEQHYDLTLAFHVELAEAAYLSGHDEEMERGIDLILRRARTLLDRISAYEARIWAYIAQNKLREAVTTGLGALRLLGLEFPEEPTQADVGQGLAETQAVIAGRRIEEFVNLPEMEDPHLLAAMRTLSVLSNASYGGFPELYSLVILKMVQLSVQHGHSLQSATAYASYGLILSGVVGDIDAGYEFGRLALGLVERLNLAEQEPMPAFLFHSFIGHQKEHTGRTVKPLLELHRHTRETGALGIAGASLFFSSAHAFWAGQELSGLERELLTYAEALAQLNQKPFLYMIQLYRQAALNLIGPAQNACRLAGESYDEEKMLPLHEEVNHQAAINFLYLSKLFLCYLFQQPRAAVQHADTAEKYLPATMGMVTVPVFYFYDALARLAVYPEADPAEREEILARVSADQEKIENWARHAPMNHRHKHLLVEAERARVLGQDSEARDYFDQAIDLARENGYLHEEGLANELAGQFYLARGQARVAEHYLRDAHYAYLHWGAAAKAEELKARFPQFLAQDTAPHLRDTVTATTQTAPHLSSTLDLGSVLKASQAISGEIVLERLLTRLMRIVIENAGAQKGYLILEKKGRPAREPASRDVALADLVIEAEGTVDQAEVIAPEDAAVETSGKVPVAIVNYVARTRENVVLNDATREGIFTQDPYITRHQPKSILCMPLISQGKLNGIVYLENNLSTGAFTPDRQEVLRLLSGQAAISIANAKLYAHQVELTRAASRFVPHEFLTLLNKESLVEIKLGDHVQMDMTILVSDIRSFTTMSEKMTPQENFDFINAYLQWVAPVIRQNRGFIGKYMGDGIMAFFPGAADRAVRASIDILKQISRFNAERQAKRHAHGPVQTGIGLHTGSVMLGTVGEEGRMQGDVMSDAANLANRLEGLTKFYGASLVVSAETLHQLEDPGRYRVRFLGKLRVKGRQEAVSVFEILDGEPAPGIDLKLQTKSAFEEGLSLYYAARFDEARACFEAVLRSHPQDLAAARYLRQATEYLERGVPEEWTGVEIMTEK